MSNKYTFILIKAEKAPKLNILVFYFVLKCVCIFFENCLFKSFIDINVYKEHDYKLKEIGYEERV